MASAETAKFLLIVFALLALASATIQRKKCLFPNFVTNHTSDGLTGCVCPDHMEYDPVYGICFINQCRQQCGEMNCHIRKSNINNFQYFCSCDANFVPITPKANVGCTPFEESSGFRDAARALPRNPMFTRKLGCAHTYELADGQYRCACFEGYSLNEATGECRPKRRCSKVCGKNQVCTVNEQNESSCICKADCSNHFCDYKGASFVEQTFLDLSIREVCGVAGCRLDERSNSFSCNCNFGLITRPDGLCGLPTPCLPQNGAGYVECTNDSKFCIIALDNWNSGHKCYPPLEQSGKPTYTAKFNRSERIDFKLSMDVRLNWWEGSFYVLFVNQMNNLQSPDFQKRLPSFLWQDFLDYEQRVFWSFEEAEFYREQLDDKLRNMFWKGIKSFFSGWFAPMKDCGNFSVYPAIEYDRSALKMNRLIESIIHVDFEVTCDNLTLGRQELLDLFVTKQLKKDYIENYWYLHETGYIFPDSVRVSEFRGDRDDDGGDTDGGDKGNVDDGGDKGNVDDGGGKEKLHKCLDPRKRTDYSLDGITNCTCADGYEFDEMFGSCFENKCRNICGDSMECAIVKHNIDDFEYYCYCKPGYHRVDPYYPKGCVPSLTHFKKLLESSENSGHPLPLNPFLMDQLKCDHMYRLDGKRFVCDCYRGWEMNPQTQKCEKIKGIIAHDRPNDCSADEIFVVERSALNSHGKCVCKAGFGGLKCSNNLCNWPTPKNQQEAAYIHESIEQFCGSPRCGLAFDQFLCQCSEPFVRDRNGRCVLREHCTRPHNYGDCPKNKFCKILTNDPLGTRRPYKCVCPVEQGGDALDECLDYRTDPDKHCLPGYVENPNPRREFPQRCLHGESTFNFTFSLRFGLETNAGVLLENFHMLNDSINLSKVPVGLVDDFVGYRSRSLAYSMNGVWNKAIVKDKLQEILRQAITRYNHDIDCHRINAVPLVAFDERNFNLFRLAETLVDVNLSVTCANSITVQKFVNQFRRHLLHNQVNENFYLMQDVGHVLSESIRIL